MSVHGYGDATNSITVCANSGANAKLLKAFVYCAGLPPFVGGACDIYDAQTQAKTVLITAKVSALGSRKGTKGSWQPAAVAQKKKQIDPFFLTLCTDQISQLCPLANATATVSWPGRAEKFKRPRLFEGKR